MEWLKANDLKAMRLPTTADATASATAFLTKQGYHVDLSKSADRLVPDYSSFRNTYWGQSQPVNYKLLWKMFLEDPIVFGCVNLLVEGIVGDGYRLKGGKKLHQKVLTKLLTKNEFSRALRDVTYQFFIFGDAYLELGRDQTQTKDIKSSKDLAKIYASPYDSLEKTVKVADPDETFTITKEKINEYECGWHGCPGCSLDSDNKGKIQTNMHKVNSVSVYEKPQTGLVREFYVADASTIRIDYNEHGETIKYIQRVLHRRVDFYPNEMAHLSLNNIGGRQYGHSPLVSVIESLQAKQHAERFNSDYFKRGAIPRMVYMIPNLNEAQLVRIQNQLATLQPQQDIVLTSSDPGMKAEQLMPSNTDMQFADLLKYYKKNIISAIGVPGVFLGETDGSNRSNAQVQLEAFDRKIRGLKNVIADMLNKQFFTKENFGFDDVIFEFIEDNNREELKDAQTASLLVPMTGMIDEYGRRLATFNEIRAKMKLPLMDDEPEEGEEGEKKKDGEQPMMNQMPSPPKPSEKLNYQMNAAGYSDPRTKEDRGSNAEARNTDQQMQNKSIRPDSYSSKPYGPEDKRMRETEEWQKERREHPTMSDEEIDTIWLDHNRKKSLSQSTPDFNPERMRLRMAREQFLGAQIPSEKPGTSQTSNEQQEITPHDVTIRDREVRNPFGATQFHVEKPEHQLAAVLEERSREIMQYAYNPITNALDLNTDRVFPKDSQDVPQKGQNPAENKGEPEREANKNPERDEVDVLGRVVWASNDVDVPKDKEIVRHDKEVRERLTRFISQFEFPESKNLATFYKGTNQMEEDAHERESHD